MNSFLEKAVTNVQVHKIAFDPCARLSFWFLTFLLPCVEVHPIMVYQCIIDIGKPGVEP